MSLAESRSQVLIGTPARILALLLLGAMKLQATTRLILRDVDRLLADGFKHDVRKILAKAPTEKQVLACGRPLSLPGPEPCEPFLAEPYELVSATGPVASVCAAERSDTDLLLK